MKLDKIADIFTTISNGVLIAYLLVLLVIAAKAGGGAGFLMFFSAFGAAFVLGRWSSINKYTKELKELQKKINGE